MDAINNLTTNNSFTVLFSALLSSPDLIFIMSLFVIAQVVIGVGAGGAVVFLFRFFRQKKDTVHCIVQVQKCGVDRNVLCEVPELVLENILGYLDSKSLRMLRMVSQKTKSWIDRPYYIKKIPIYINNQTRMIKIMNSNIEWSNINIVTKEMCSEIIIPFFQHFQSSLKIINIKSVIINSQHLWIILRHVSPHLESLGFSMYITDSIPTNFDNELCEILKTNLIELKYLNLNYMYTTNSETIQCEEFLEKLIYVCQNLHVIRFPPSSCLQGELQAELFFRPVISYLKTKAVSSIHPRLKKIYLPRIWINKFSEYLFDSAIVSHVWQSSTLRELIILCEPFGIEIFNIPCIYLPNPLELSKYEMLCLNKCVKTVVSKSSNIGIRSNMYIPSGCEIHVGVFVTSSSNHSNFELAPNLNITKIYLKTDSSVECITDTTTIYNHLFQTYRPTLHTLALNGKSCFPEFKLSSNFPNLKELWICGYNHVYNERLDYMMNGLEQLKILNYYNMSCKYFIGAQKNPWLCKLKELAHINFIQPSNFEIDLNGDLETKDYFYEVESI